MLRHRINLLIIDLFLIALSYFLIISFKGGYIQYLSPAYLYGLAIFSSIWIVVSALFKKFFPTNPPQNSVSLHILVINLLIFGIIVISMYGARHLAYSRLVVFGTIGLLTVVELIVNKLYRLLVQNGNGAYLAPPGKATPLHGEEAQLKATQDLHIRDISLSAKQLKRDIIKECGELGYEYIEHHADLLDPKNLVISTTTRFNILYQPENYLTGIINLKRVNDIRYVNKFFETVNVKLPPGGQFIGHVETAALRQKRILKKYPPVLNRIFFTLDFIIKRILPKFKVTRGLYFFLTRGQNRVFTHAEILGRLYSCGFEVESEGQLNGQYFFNVKKASDPCFPKNPTYGFLVRLPRMGLGGKVIRVYKVRTMHPYAEYLQDYVYKKHSLQEGGKFSNDFRISRIGKIMRALWIDELPMLINWMRGDLKLVGVRPISKHYFSLYSEEHQKRRIKYKPGLVPPYYADLPKTLSQIEASEKAFFDAYEKHPFRTNWRYFWKAIFNILFKNARSQ